jgi:hypothetical protein
MKRKQSIRLAILRTLAAADDKGFTVSEDTLFADLLTLVRPAPGLLESREIIMELEAANRIASIVQDDEKHFTITKSGRLWKLQQEQG